MLSVLYVRLHEKIIGTLTRVAGDRSLFSFNQEYINDSDRAALSLCFKDVFGELRTDFKPVQTRVMPFFSNLLPEGHLRKYLAEQAGVHAEREFFLLWALGRDLPGAITIVSAEDDTWPPDAMISEEWDESLAKENMLRFSLAGVQLKFSAVENAGGGGLTVPASGVGGDWIVKLPSREFTGVPENEYSMMYLASQLGINVPRIELVDMENISGLPDGIQRFGSKAFAIRRFDRLESGVRVHIEDFAQVFGVYGSEKYKRASVRNIATVVAAEGTDEDIRELIRRLTFNTLIGNGDMHLKNWSLIYPDRKNAALAPAYDFVSTISYLPGETSALRYSRTKSFSGYSEDELSHLCAKAGLPEKMVLDTARETAADFMTIWKREKEQLPMLHTVRQAIDALLPTIPLARTTNR